MNLKELMMPFALAVLTTLAFQYFFFNKENSAPSIDGAKSGERFVAPKVEDAVAQKPLNLEVDFLDQKTPHNKAVTTNIATNDALYIFSSEGAALQHVEFKRNWGGKEGYLSTVFPPSFHDRERAAFLVALNTPTPYFYELVDKQDEQDRAVVSYKATTEQAIVEKKFTVFKNEHRVALELTITPQAGKAITPRILFPSPLVSELGQKDVINALVNTVKNSVGITRVSEALLNEYWAKPTLFGAEDRYFIHAMVADTNYFAQRGYYKLQDLELLTSIIEGPEVTEKKTWLINFYVGPKEDSAILAVDGRLEDTLNYGYLAFISRPVSKILLEILNFFYGYVKNYGFAIIIVTLLIKLLMLPFSLKAEKGQQGAQEFQKKMKHIETKYKNDPQALAQARAELLKAHGLPIGGCVPLLLQIPLFIAFNWVIANSIELYMAPFLWIRDLSAPDPYYILPVLVALSVMASSLVTPAQKNQQGFSTIGLALVFGAFASTFSAGVALFIVTNASMHALQLYLTKKK